MTVTVSTNGSIRDPPSVSFSGCQSASYCGSRQLSAWPQGHTVLPRTVFISHTYGSVCQRFLISFQVALTRSQITIIRTISTLVAITSILGFYKRLKSVLKPRGALRQLICFKVIVFLNFLQTLIFSFLRKGDLHASRYFTFNDLSNGLPALILCCELALISPFFVMTYSVKPYVLGGMSSAENLSSQHAMRHYQGGPLGFYAILQAINVFDLVIELLKIVKLRPVENVRNLEFSTRRRPTRTGYVRG